VNPSTAFGVTFADELVRCGLADVVCAPGSRNAPLAMAFFDLARRGRLRLHVRIDERSAAFLALGLARAARRPVAVACTSGTAAASFHPAVIEAGQSCVPLLVLTADRPPELRGTGANQAIDQIKLYGSAVRWFCEAGVPERRPGMVAYWRSLACAAWARAAGAVGGPPGPVHLNLPLREPLVPDAPPPGCGPDGPPREDRPAAGGTVRGDDWPEPLGGRPGGAAWTRVVTGQADPAAAGQAVPPAVPLVHSSAPGRPGGSVTRPGVLELPWTERGVVVCGDGACGDYDAGPLLDLAERAGWPVLAEPSSGARRGPNALGAYQYLLATPAFMAGHRPDVIVSAGRPGLSRAQMAFLGGGFRMRHVVITQAPGQWADPARSATDVAAAVRLAAPRYGSIRDSHGGSGWLASWKRADAAARRAADAILDSSDVVSEPRLARDLAAALPDGALLWAASSLPVRDLDQHMAPREGLRVLASRGASGIDGTVSAAIGAALAHQAAGGGPAFALVGDLAFLHDMPGLALGPAEPRPDLCLVVVNNDGGGIFSLLEQAAFAGPAGAEGAEGPFERVFGTPHGTGIRHLAAAFRLPYARAERASGLAAALRGRGLRIAEVRTDRAAGAGLRSALQTAAVRAVLGAQQAEPPQ
jgi:2-succinyl-5-enolpyruvyl-6-hydroxy-3-cyclohexene-1-carboxylate synthase